MLFRMYSDTLYIWKRLLIIDRKRILHGNSDTTECNSQNCLLQTHCGCGQNSDLRLFPLSMKPLLYLGQGKSASLEWEQLNREV